MFYGFVTNSAGRAICANFLLLEECQIRKKNLKLLQLYGGAGFLGRVGQFSKILALSQTLQSS